MKMIKILKLADFFTIGNLIFGLLSIFHSISGLYIHSAIFLVIAMLFDFLDGKIAGLSKIYSKEKESFGKELDSLSDVVSFGVAPSVFGYSLGLTLWWHVIILLFFTISGMLRLSRFNISVSDGYFEGVPITANGLLFPVLFYIHLLTAFPIEYTLIPFTIMGFAMTSSLKIKKFI